MLVQARKCLDYVEQKVRSKGRRSICRTISVDTSAFSLERKKRKKETKIINILSYTIRISYNSKTTSNDNFVRIKLLL